MEDTVSDYFETGFAVRQPSWHGKETLLTEDQRPRTWAEARPLAGLDWEIVREPMYTRTLAGMNADGSPHYEYIEVPEFHVDKRDDTNEVLTADRNSRHLINNQDLGEILHALTDKTELEYETGGSVRGGRSVWALVKLGGERTIGIDLSPVRPYMGIVNHIDRVGGCRAYQTSVRIVCANTMAMADAQADRDGTVANFSHRENWRDHLETARQAIMGAQSEFGEWVKMAEHLQGLTVTDEMAEDFVREFHPYPGRNEDPETRLVSERVAGNIEKARTDLRYVLHESRTSEGIKGTGYWLVQGAVEWLDHLRPIRKQEAYVARTVIDPQKGKTLAVAKVLELCK
jgi:phage/plasmid-like protein (TIGR03299 family)